MTDEFESLDADLQKVIAEARRPVPVDADARTRLLRALRAEPVPSRQPTVLAWLSRPQHIELRPMVSAALAAGLVGIGILSGLAINRDGRLATEQRPAVAVGQPQLPDSLAANAVKFVIAAPQASAVSLVGDFNRWDPVATPMMSQGQGGLWTVVIPLRPGIHTYSFVVDGHFVSDPAAPIAPDDGFGHRNSVVYVRKPSL